MNKFLITLLLLVITSSFNLNAQNDSINSKYYVIPDLFKSDEIMHVTIITDLKSVKSDVYDNREYHSAAFIFSVGDIKEKHLPVKIKTRGHFRRSKANCSFPPLKLKFSRKAREFTLFHKYKKLKLVTHCRTKSSKYEQAILQEYLAYKVYNILTEKSFKVKLAKINYIDSKAEMNPISKYAFFIEDELIMSERLSGKLLEVQKVQHHETQQRTMILLSVFQYFIGNTDWSVPALHNIKLVSTNPYQPPFTVPYDFDWSGIVNSSYAVPSEKLEISTVRERLYRGFAHDRTAYQEAINLFKEKKEAIYKLYNEFSYLNSKQKKMSINYINDFYKIIEKENSINNVFIRGARQK